jgi:hypothetical protein
MPKKTCGVKIVWEDAVFLLAIKSHFDSHLRRQELANLSCDKLFGLSCV